VNGDADVPDEVVVAAEHEAEEVGEAFKRPAIGAVVPIRDPEDEPYVFRFEVGPAILTQLLEKLRQLEPRSLTESLDAKYPGFYQLFLDGKPVYIGKTARAVGDRLTEHLKKISGRIALERITCKFAYVEDPSLVDVAEGTLINFFSVNEGGEWNRSGFGSKVTGYRRGRQSGSEWEAQFPPDLLWPIKAGAPQLITLAALIKQIARNSPITVSIPRDHQAAFAAAHPNRINVPTQTKPFEEWIAFIQQNLSDHWAIDRQASAWYVEPNNAAR
jgi:hypothetical protein